MSTTERASSSSRVSEPIRSAFAQSTATTVRSAMSAGTSRRSSSSCMNAYSRGTGVEPDRNITTSLPSCRSASVIASKEPSASPSGFSWVTTRRRSLSRSAATTACRSLDVCVILGCELIDQAAHPHTVLDRRIVLERQLRSSLQSQLAGEPPLQDAVGGVEAAECRRPFLLGAEHADEDRRRAKVRRGIDAGHRHEADPGVLQLGQRLREHLPNRLIDASHALGHRTY